MRLVLALLTLQLAPAVCAAQSPAVPPATVNGVEASVGMLHTIALDIDQRRDLLYCYFGSREVTPAVRVRIDSVATVAAAQDCNGIGLGFVMRSTDRALLVQMARGVIQSNPRFDVVTVFYGTEDVDRFGDTVRVARSFSVLRGVATTLAHDVAPRDGQ